MIRKLYLKSRFPSYTSGRVEMLTIVGLLKKDEMIIGTVKQKDSKKSATATKGEAIYVKYTRQMQ